MASPGIGWCWGPGTKRIYSLGLVVCVTRTVISFFFFALFAIVTGALFPSLLLFKSCSNPLEKSSRCWGLQTSGQTLTSGYKLGQKKKRGVRGAGEEKHHDPWTDKKEPLSSRAGRSRGGCRILRVRASGVNYKHQIPFATSRDLLLPRAFARRSRKDANDRRLRCCSWPELFSMFLRRAPAPLLRAHCRAPSPASPVATASCDWTA